MDAHVRLCAAIYHLVRDPAIVEEFSSRRSTRLDADSSRVTPPALQGEIRAEGKRRRLEPRLWTSERFDGPPLSALW